jgi:polyhydroxyalkanoate synthase
MQLHHGLRRTMLELADEADAWAASAVRAGLHAQAAWAQMLRGEAPIGPIAGPATPHRVADEHRLARLLHYAAAPGAGASRRAAPLLVVASLINKYYVLDLLPELSVIDGLRRRGFDVYVLDWKPPGGDGPGLTFADYVDGAIDWGAQRAAALAKAGQVAVLGYCMGGTMAAIHAARHGERVAALALLGTPIDFHASGVLAEWTRRERFDADLVVDVCGNMPPALMQSGFRLMKPIETLSKMMRLHQQRDRVALRHMVALEAWLADNFAFPGGVYRDYIRALYQDNALARGALHVGGERVDLGRIRAPLHDVVALRDHICEPPSSRALMDLVGSTDKRLLEFDTGHIGLTASRRALDGLWPEIGRWLEERCR